MENSLLEIPSCIMWLAQSTLTVRFSRECRELLVIWLTLLCRE